MKPCRFFPVLGAVPVPVTDRRTGREASDSHFAPLIPPLMGSRWSVRNWDAGRIPLNLTKVCCCSNRLRPSATKEEKNWIRRARNMPSFAHGSRRERPSARERRVPAPGSKFIPLSPGFCIFPMRTSNSPFRRSSAMGRGEMSRIWQSLRAPTPRWQRFRGKD